MIRDGIRTQAHSARQTIRIAQHQRVLLEIGRQLEQNGPVFAQRRDYIMEISQCIGAFTQL